LTVLFIHSCLIHVPLHSAGHRTKIYVGPNKITRHLDKTKTDVALHIETSDHKVEIRI
jgi:hypothetical protein